MEEILRGTWPAITVSQLRAAPFDEKISVMGLILSRLSEESRRTHTQEELTADLHGHLKEFRERLNEGEEPTAILDAIIRRLQEDLRRERDAGRLDKEGRGRFMRELTVLEDYRARLVDVPADGAMDAVRTWFGKETEKLDIRGEETGGMYDNAFRFLEDTFALGQELVLFVTEITAGYDTSWFVENFGCDAYFRHNKDLLVDSTRQRLSREILELRGQ